MKAQDFTLEDAQRILEIYAEIANFSYEKITRKLTPERLLRDLQEALTDRSKRSVFQDGYRLGSTYDPNHSKLQLSLTRSDDIDFHFDPNLSSYTKHSPQEKAAAQQASELFTNRVHRYFASRI